MKKTLLQIVLFIQVVLLAGSLSAQKKTLLTKDTIKDDHIVYPIDMEMNYDELLSDWKNNMLIPADCSLLDSPAITFDDSVYIRRLYSLPTKMELVFNPVVKQYIEMYSGRRRQQVSYMLGQSAYYFPMFENALDREELPLELKYLPVIESALNPIAHSRAGASGLWQFMASTGKLYNLEINSLVDERRDPLKSTNAAVKYLKDLYNIYGDWNLVIAAYNCGPGNVNKAIRRSGGQTDYWAIYPYLPRETRGYVPAFIAATYIMNYYNEHNICPAECKFPPAMDTLVVNKYLHLQQVSDLLNVPIDDVRAYNPQFKSDIVPGEYKPYALSLPIDKITSFIDNSDTIYAHRASELLTHRKIAGLDVVGGSAGAGGRVHRIKKGETLGSIASHYGVTIAQLQRWNGLKSSSLLSIGKRLIVSPATPAAPKKVIAQNKVEIEEQIISTPDANDDGRTLTKVIKVSKPQTTTTYYTIKRGDNLTDIADKNKVNVADLRAWNNLKGDNIFAGEKLKIIKTQMVEIEEKIEYPEPILSSISVDEFQLKALVEEYIDHLDKERSNSLLKITSENNRPDHSEMNDTQIIYHKVRIGETIPQIAKRYNVSKKDIITWNKLSSGIAKVGQRLLIYLPQKYNDGSAA